MISVIDKSKIHGDILTLKITDGSIDDAKRHGCLKRCSGYRMCGINSILALITASITVAVFLGIHLIIGVVPVT